MTAGQLRRATRDDIRWGTRFVAVCIHNSCTLVETEEGEIMGTLQETYESEKYYYHFG